MFVIAKTESRLAHHESVQFDAHLPIIIDPTPPNNPDYSRAKSIHEFTVKSLWGELVKLDTFKGYVCIVVNIATKSPFTENHYKQFGELLDKYEDTKGFRILGFPCNQFGHEEPGSSNEIAAHADAHNVQFDIFHKVEVNGENASPLWKYMKHHLRGSSKLGDMIKWNFTKFIVTRDGIPVKRYGPEVEPSKFKELLKPYW